MTPAQKNLMAIRERLEELSRPNVRIIAVTKTHGPETIEDLLAVGHRDFGENRQNEARDKFHLVRIPDPKVMPIYHHIGPLQSGAARQIPSIFHYVHGASSVEAIQALAKAALKHIPDDPDPDRWPIRYLIQVDLTGEVTKLGGMSREELMSLSGFPENEALRFCGFMTMGPESMEPIRTREVFHELREIRDRISPSGELSMGMSGDWEIAVSEGATMIRLGTVLYGKRESGPWKPSE
jgi:hypothetical protein